MSPSELIELNEFLNGKIATLEAENAAMRQSLQEIADASASIVAKNAATKTA